MDLKKRIFEEACRLCASLDNKVEKYQICGTPNHEYSIPDLIRKCIDIEITENSECQNICKNCLRKLDLMHQLVAAFKQGSRDFDTLVRSVDSRLQLSIEPIDFEPDTGLQENSSLLDKSVESNLIRHLIVLVKPLKMSDLENVCDDDATEFSEGEDIEEATEGELDESVYENAENIAAFMSKGKDVKTEREDFVGRAREYACEFCGSVFTSKRYLTLHTRDHFQESRFALELADLNFRHCINEDAISIPAHEYLYQCEICNEIIELHQNSSLKRFAAELRLHNRLNHGQSLECPICRGIYETVPKLKRHVAAVHTERHHECEFCGKRFKSGSHLDNHRRVHTGEKPYLCEICNRGFAQTGGLITHMKIHTGEKNFPCDFCHQRFRQKAGLRMHQKSKACRKKFRFS